jgi:ribosomal protein S18 acetylase RimI-like enzyme
MPLVLERSWVGRRVSVRRTVQTPDGRDAFSDVVGDLVALDAERAIVDTRTGPVEVALDTVAAATAPRPSTRDELHLEDIVARGWRARDTSRLGGWLLRADSGFTGRANSVLPLAAPGAPLEAALQHVGRWYAERDLPARFQVPVEARRLLDAALGEHGWAPSAEVHVMCARLDQLPAGEPASVEVRPGPDEHWFELYRDGAAAASPAARELVLRHERVGFASLRAGDELLAIGRGTVDDDWLGITAVEVRPDARRRGHARAVMAALWRWGERQGAARTHLEVSSDNRSAVELYRDLGYWVHHDYRYRTAPPA